MMLLFASVALFEGCGVRLPDPVLQSVEPDRGWNGEQTVVSVEGGNFYPQVQVNANRRADADLDRSFAAWLVSGAAEFPLSGVSALDYDHLSAVVEPALPPGVYDLIVEGPTGARATLEQAFTVSDTRADRLGLQSESIVYTVNEQTFIDLQLLDPAGDPVLADLEVQIRVMGTTQAIDAIFGAALNNQIVAPDGLSITGFLGADGGARIPLVVATPDTVVVEAVPVDATSPVRSDEITLLWQVGGDLSTEIELPATPLSVAAGESFDVTVTLLDQFGNAALGAEETVLLQTSCADFNTVANVAGTAVVTITPSQSTQFDPDCLEQRLQVLSGPPGTSAPFEVRAGPAVGFDVQAAPLLLTAGESINAVISPRDAFANRTTFGDPVVVSDSVGGLGAVVCTPLQVDDRFCTAPSFVAGPSVQLLVNSGVVVGQSTAYVVQAAGIVDSVMVMVTGPVAAGVPFLVAVRAEDEFGNPIDGNALGASVWSVEDELAEVSCTEQPVLPDGSLATHCTVLTARSAATLTVDLDGVVASAAPFSVVNGPLAVAVVSAPASAVAGQPFDVQIETFDAHGNAYLEQSGAGVAIVDEIGTPLGAVILDGAGLGGSTVALTVAGLSRVTAVTGAEALGESGLISVQPAAAVELRLDPGSPWVWVGDSVEVEVESVDAFGNRGAESFDVVVSSAANAGGDVMASLVNGLAMVSFVWSTSQLDEQLDATGGSLSGNSEAFDVVEECGGAGPTAVVDFAGQPFGRTCLNPILGSASLGFSASTEGAQPLARFSASIAGVPTFISTIPSVTVDVDRAGETEVRALVVDAALCGSEATTAIWAGPDDGDPVGPLDLTLSDATLVVGVGSTMGHVSSAVDCTGDPALAGRIAVRANRGSILGAGQTGAGLELVLDGSGSVDFTLDASMHSTGGTGSVWLRTASGGARGMASADFVGDDRAPQVWAQTPSGDTSGNVGTVDLTFSEPMLVSTMLPGAFSLDGPSLVGVSSAIALDETTWQLVLDGPIDAASGFWTLTADTTLRDLGGNRLDGAFDGGPSSWIQPFGAVPGIVEPVSCGVETARFRPDGDPGVGEQADTVEFSFEASTTPVWWVIRVDDGGQTLDQVWMAPGGGVDVWTWDGRDVTERVLDAGTYLLEVRADDGSGNRSVPCTVSVTIEVDP